MKCDICDAKVTEQKTFSWRESKTVLCVDCFALLCSLFAMTAVSEPEPVGVYPQSRSRKELALRQLRELGDRAIGRMVASLKLSCSEGPAADFACQMHLSSLEAVEFALRGWDELTISQYLESTFGSAIGVQRKLAMFYCAQCAVPLLPEKASVHGFGVEDAFSMVRANLWLGSGVYGFEVVGEVFVDFWLRWLGDAITDGDSAARNLRKRLTLVVEIGTAGVLSTEDPVNWLVSRRTMDAPDLSVKMMSRMWDQSYEAVCLRGLQDVAGVSIDFTRHLRPESFRDSTDSYLRRATVHLRHGDTGAACRRLADCLRLNPSFRPAERILANLRQ